MGIALNAFTFFEDLLLNLKNTSSAEAIQSSLVTMSCCMRDFPKAGHFLLHLGCLGLLATWVL